MNFWPPRATGTSCSDFPDPWTKETRFRTRVTEVAGVRRWGPEAEQSPHTVDADAHHPTTLHCPTLQKAGALFTIEHAQTPSARALDFVVPSKVIPSLILISLCRKWYVFHQFILEITFQTVMPRIVRVCWNLWSSLKLKVRPLQIKGCYFSNRSCVWHRKGTVGWRYPLLLTVLSFLCSSSFKSFIKNNRNSCSFNFYNNNMLENSLKRYRQYIFYFQTTDPRGLSSGY